MSSFERDTIKRQIRQLGDAIAALLFRARAEGNYETGLEAVRRTAAAGLGVDYALLSRLAPESAAMLLRDAEVVRTYAWICSQEADLMELAGDSEAAGAMRKRADDLSVEAERRDGGPGRAETTSGV